MKKNAEKIGMATVILIVIFLFFFFDPLKYIFPKCPFHQLTGLYCPGCGSQRAIHGLLHLHIRDAISQNLLLVIFVPFALFYYLTILLKKEHLHQVIYSNKFIWIILIVIILFAILRNIELFSFLAPDLS